MNDIDRIYIAGPLFKPAHIEVIKNIEQLLDSLSCPYFSPREFGVIADEKMTPERMRRIYDMNIDMVAQCDTMIAIIDDRDTGTVFEIGYASAMSKNIITYSSQGYGVNVMLAHAVFTHTQNLEELQQALNGHKIEELEIVE